MVDLLFKKNIDNLFPPFRITIICPLSLSFLIAEVLWMVNYDAVFLSNNKKP